MRQLAPESLMKFIRSKVKSTINTWIIPYTLRRHTSSQVDRSNYPATCDVIIIIMHLYVNSQNFYRFIQILILDDTLKFQSACFILQFHE